MMRDDAQLVAAYLEGDERALETLVDRYVRDVHRFALTLTHDAQAAEDVVQESFVKAWKHIRRYHAGSSFRTWLFSIARNTAIDWLRRKKEIAFSSFENDQGENTLLATLADGEPLPDELLAQAHDAAYLARLLADINSDYREVLTLRHTSNLTFEEIGSIVKRPLHTVKSQYRRAIIALRRLAKTESA